MKQIYNKEKWKNNCRIIAELSDKEGFDVKNINSVAEETAQKHQKSWKRI
jgi:hypothetical protein